VLTAQQIEERRTGIGSSDIAAVVGASPWAGPLDIWLDKQGLASPFLQNEAILWGDLLEDPIAREYARRTSQSIARPEGTIRRKDRPWMLCHPDRIIVGKSKGLECKNRGLRQAHRYGEGPQDCQEEEICQAAWCMACTDCEEWDVAVLLGGQELRIFTLERDLELEGMMIEAGDRFWDLVQRKVLPPVDGSQAFQAYLTERYPRDRRPLRVATVQEQEWMLELYEVRRQQRLLAQDHDRLENLLKDSIKEAGGIFWEDLRILWRNRIDGPRPFVPNF
jgi:putative phage-type endonuclease